MGRSRYKIFEEHYPYFITSTLLEELPLFSKPEIAQILLDQLIYLQDRRSVILYAYVIMETHFHAVIQGHDLSEKLRLTKSYSAWKILEVLEIGGHTRWLKILKRRKKAHKKGRTHQVWNEGFHPKQLSSMNMMEQKIDYLHWNPVKAGLVDVPEHWRYSSARNYQGEEGLIPVTLFAG